MRALQIAATGMSAQQTRVDVISNNLANMSTTGYNPRRAEFADLQYQQAVRPGTLTATNGAMVPAGVQLGLGVRPAAVTVMLGQGTLSRELGVRLDDQPLQRAHDARPRQAGSGPRQLVIDPARSFQRQPRLAAPRGALGRQADARPLQADHGPRRLHGAPRLGRKFSCQGAGIAVETDRADTRGTESDRQVVPRGWLALTAAARADQKTGS